MEMKISNYRYGVISVQLFFFLSDVQVTIYDILGREVQILVNEVKSPGQYIVTFNGQKLSSGIYFYSLHAGSFSETKKFILLQ